MEVDQTNQKPVEGQSLPFVEKYRPKDLGEIISHVDIVHTSNSNPQSLQFFFSKEVYREQKHAASVVPWTSWHWQDIVHDCDS